MGMRMGVGLVGETFRCVLLYSRFFYIYKTAQISHSSLNSDYYGERLLIRGGATFAFIIFIIYYFLFLFSIVSMYIY
jgi:hypothetical protein